MKRRILPGSRSGAVTAPASKSHAHRLLLCAALSREESRIRCGTLSRDLLATVNCLRALGAEIREEGDAILCRSSALRGAEIPLALQLRTSE